jgi:cyclohexyl-isocyanide hydratase
LLEAIDLTGPFEVLSRTANSTYRIYGKTTQSLRDVRGLVLTLDAALSDAAALDILRASGGFGQEALMEDEEVQTGYAGKRWEHAAFSRSARALCCAAPRVY